MKTRTTETTETIVYRTLTFTFNMNDETDRENYAAMIDFANDLTYVSANPVIETKPAVKTKPAKKKRTYHHNTSQSILDALRTGPCTLDELMSTLELTKSAVHSAIYKLRKDDKFSIVFRQKTYTLID